MVKFIIYTRFAFQSHNLFVTLFLKANSNPQARIRATQNTKKSKNCSRILNYILKWRIDGAKWMVEMPCRDYFMMDLTEWGRKEREWRVSVVAMHICDICLVCFDCHSGNSLEFESIHKQFQRWKKKNWKIFKSKWKKIRLEIKIKKHYPCFVSICDWKR